MLQLEDLALACACAAGSNEAWDHFVQEYRPILYRAADALDPSGGGREVADSLYAELFGLRDRGGERQSLFSHFHGRSSLATWLRAVLAQRFVDRARSRRRLDPLLARHARAHRADDRWWDDVGFAPDYDSRPPHNRRVRFERCLLDSRAGRHGFSHGGWSDVPSSPPPAAGPGPGDPCKNLPRLRSKTRRALAPGSREPNRRPGHQEITFRNPGGTSDFLISGTWQMLRSSHDWTKTSAWAAQFTVPVAANSTTELRYRVRVTY